MVKHTCFQKVLLTTGQLKVKVKSWVYKLILSLKSNSGYIVLAASQKHPRRGWHIATCYS